MADTPSQAEILIVGAGLTGLVISPYLRSVSTDHGIPVHVFAWQADMTQTGLQRDAIYLVRPDGYVALANAESDEATIETYLSEHKIGVIAQPAAASATNQSRNTCTSRCGRCGRSGVTTK
jgi:hypothetical protein